MVKIMPNENLQLNIIVILDPEVLFQAGSSSLVYVWHRLSNACSKALNAFVLLESKQTKLYP